MKSRIAALFILLCVSCEHAQDIPMLFIDDASGYSNEERPRVIASQPYGNAGSVSTGVQVYVDFNIDMDKEITRNAFSLSSTSVPAGRVEWVGNRRLQYKLDEGLTAGQVYNMKVDGSARSAKGYTLDIDYLVHFTAGSRTDGPEVISTDPAANAQSVAQNSALRVLFSRAMNRSSVEAAFSLSPSAAGSFTWDADSKGFTYTPYALLTFGTTYALSINTGAKDQESIPLSSSFNMSFQVGTDFTPPQINQVLESGNPTAIVTNFNGFFKDSRLTVYFSEAMNFSVVQSAFSLTRTSNSTLVNGVFSWNAAFTQLTFTPSAALEPLNQYLLIVTTGAKDAAGNSMSAPLQIYFTVSNANGALHSNYITMTQIMKTLPLPVNAFTLSPNVTNLVDIGPPPDLITLDVVFSHSLDLNTIAEKISITRLFTNTNPGAGQIISIIPGNFGALTNNRLTIEIDQIGLNEYKLQFSGGRNGIRSAATAPETGTWLQSSNTFFLRGQ